MQLQSNARCGVIAENGLFISWKEGQVREETRSPRRAHTTCPHQELMWLLKLIMAALLKNPVARG